MKKTTKKVEKQLSLFDSILTIFLLFLILSCCDITASMMAPIPFLGKITQFFWRVPGGGLIGIFGILTIYFYFIFKYPEFGKNSRY